MQTLKEQLQDSGWINMELQDGYTNSALPSSGAMQYRKKGEVVYIKGSCKGFSAANEICAYLPKNYRPLSRHDFYLGTTSYYTAKAMIATDGSISLIGDSRNTYSTEQWYSFCTCFLAS